MISEPQIWEFCSLGTYQLTDLVEKKFDEKHGNCVSEVSPTHTHRDSGVPEKIRCPLPHMQGRDWRARFW